MYKSEQEIGMYDFGWRQYMPDIGRWNGMDQLSEMYAPISPYAYVANNPVSLMDPDGRKVVETATGWTFTGSDIQGVLNYFGSGGSYVNFVSDLENGGGSFGSSPVSNFWGNHTPGPNWFGRTWTNIKSFFGWGKKETTKSIGRIEGGDVELMEWNEMDLIESVFFEEPPMFGETNTITRSYDLPETSLFNYLIELNYRNSDKTLGTKGKINTDTEEIIEVINPKRSWVRKNYQLISPSYKASAFWGLNRPTVGLSLEQSFFGMLGVAGVITADLSQPQHSSVSIRFSENINLNHNSKSIGIGIKPIGALILILSRGSAGAGAFSPVLR